MAAARETFHRSGRRLGVAFRHVRQRLSQEWPGPAGITRPFALMLALLLAAADPAQLAGCRSRLPGPGSTTSRGRGPSSCPSAQLSETLIGAPQSAWRTMAGGPS